MANIEEAIKKISSSEPEDFKARMESIAAINGEIILMERQLGLPPKMPTINAKRTLNRYNELKALLAEKTTAPKPAAPAASDATDAARPFESTGDSTTDAAIKAAGCHSLAEFKSKGRRDNLFGTACNLPPGSLARQCVEKNLADAQAKLNQK
jgi:hypothetical protein